MCLSQASASLWALFSSSENERLATCHLSDPSLQAVASGSPWGLWWERGSQHSSLPPCQPNALTSRTHGLARSGPPPALTQPARVPPHMHCCSFCLVCWNILGDPGRRLAAHTCTHTHTSESEQILKATAFKQVQRTCQEPSWHCLPWNTWSCLTLGNKTISVWDSWWGGWEADGTPWARARQAWVTLTSPRGQFPTPARLQWQRGEHEHSSSQPGPLFRGTLYRSPATASLGASRWGNRREMAGRAHWLPMEDLSLIEVVRCQLRAWAEPARAAAAPAALSQSSADTRGCMSRFQRAGPALCSNSGHRKPGPRALSTVKQPEAGEKDCKDNSRPLQPGPILVFNDATSRVWQERDRDRNK